MSKKYVVFGGTFDPFTMSHRAIVKELYDGFNADLVVVAPSVVDWYRKDKRAWMDYDQKIKTINNMLDDIFAEHPCYLWTNDISRMKTCRTDAAKSIIRRRGFIDTLLDIKAYFNSLDIEWHFCIGSDQLEFFKNWKMWEEVLNQAKMVVVQGRNGKKVENGIPHDDIWIDDQYMDMSASKIRQEYEAEYKTPEDYVKWAYDKFICDRKVETLLTTPIFNVTRGPEAGNGLKPIKVVAPDWVSIMVERDGKLLVEKQFRYGANDYVEEFPCGMVEKGEDPLDAVRRELLEETGIDIINKKDIVKFGQTNPNPAFMTNKMHYYYVNLDYSAWEKRPQKLDEHEEIALEWKDMRAFMFDLADDAHACGKKQVPAIALSMVKLYENAYNYPSCG